MRRILVLIFSILICCACVDDSVKAGGGRNPLSDHVVSESAVRGQEAVIQWNGFQQNAKVFLVDENDIRYEAEVKAITSSGMIFIVPASAASGTYRVLLVQGEEYLMGSIDVLETKIPVTGITFPSAVYPGGTFVLGGVGLDASFGLILRSSSGQIMLDSELSSAGLDCILPSDMASGMYSLVLTDGSDEWVLTTSFLVSKKKILSAVALEEPYEGEVWYRTEYRVVRENGDIAAILFTQSLVQDAQVVEVKNQDKYVQVSPGYFVVEGGSSSSNNMDFRYVYDGDGRIVSADVLRFSRNNPDGVHREFTWNYGSDGMPVDVQFELNGKIYSMQDYIYEDGNLLETQASVFVYDDETLVPNPFGADAAHGFDMMHNLMEPFLYVHYLAGAHPFTSRLLPSGYMAISGPTTRVKKPFTYLFDEDGYVVEMSWRGERNSVSNIRYEYID